MLFYTDIRKWFQKRSTFVLPDRKSGCQFENVYFHLLFQIIQIITKRIFAWPCSVFLTLPGSAIRLLLCLICLLVFFVCTCQPVFVNLYFCLSRCFLCFFYGCLVFLQSIVFWSVQSVSYSWPFCSAVFLFGLFVVVVGHQFEDLFLLLPYNTLTRI